MFLLWTILFVTVGKHAVYAVYGVNAVYHSTSANAVPRKLHYALSTIVKKTKVHLYHISIGVTELDKIVYVRFVTF